MNSKTMKQYVIDAFTDHVFAGNSAAVCVMDAWLPEEGRDYFGPKQEKVPLSEMLYIGFWTDNGNADKATLALLQKLRSKRIFLFGTAGFGSSEAYFRQVLDRVKPSIDASNTVVGGYMCQGKMPFSVRERYIKMQAQPDHPANLDALIENYDRALSHPDAEDLNNLCKLVLS